jgi:O-succinylbenzoate synthase
MEGTVSLKNITLYLIDLPQKSTFRSGIGVRKSKKTILVKWVDADGLTGFGECSCRPDPYYSAEFIPAAITLLNKFIIPELQPTQTYAEVVQTLKKVRGWNFTKAGVEAAMYQVLRQQPGNKTIGDYVKSDLNPHIPVGISLGMYEDRAAFRAVVMDALEEGYKRLKFKIAPWLDTGIFDDVLALLQSRQVSYSFDANGSFQDGQLEQLGFYADTGGHVEQPTPPDRFDLLLEVKRRFPSLTICFDEEVESIGDAMKLHRLGVLDELNLKIGRVGGLTNSIEILNFCIDQNVPCWMGGMFETGVGRLQNLELAAYMPMAKASDLSPSSRYFVEDIISPEIQMKDGIIDLNENLETAVLQEKIDRYTLQKFEFDIH